MARYTELLENPEKSGYFEKTKEVAQVLLSNPVKTLEVLALVVGRLKDIKNSKGALNTMSRNSLLLVYITRAYLKGEFKFITWKKVVLAVAALIYLIYVVDLIPDIIPIFGLLDDAGVIGFVVHSLRNEIHRFRALNIVS